MRTGRTWIHDSLQNVILVVQGVTKILSRRVGRLRSGACGGFNEALGIGWMLLGGRGRTNTGQKVQF